MMRKFSTTDESLEQRADDFLSDTKFRDFFATYPDVATATNNPEEIIKRYEIFQRISEVASKIKGISKETLKSVAGQEFKDADLACIDAKVNEMAIKRPDDFEQFCKDMDEFDEQEKLYGKNERKLDDIKENETIEHNTEDIAALKEKEKVVRKALGATGMWGSLKSKVLGSAKGESYLEQAKLLGLKVDRASLTKALNRTQSNLESVTYNQGKLTDVVQTSQKCAEQLKVMRRELLEAIVSTRDIQKLVEDKATQEFATLGKMDTVDDAETEFAYADIALNDQMTRDPASPDIPRLKAEYEKKSKELKDAQDKKIKELQEAQEKIETMKESKDDGEEFLRGVDVTTIKDSIKSSIEPMLQKRIRDIFASPEVQIKSKSLRDFEVMLDPYIKNSKEEKNDKERRLIIGTLVDISHSLAPTEVIKRIYLSRILAKLRRI